jgi:hypothetical protein
MMYMVLQSKKIDPGALSMLMPVEQFRRWALVLSRSAVGGPRPLILLGRPRNYAKFFATRVVVVVVIIVRVLVVIVVQKHIPRSIIITVVVVRRRLTLLATRTSPTVMRRGGSTTTDTRVGNG